MESVNAHISLIKQKFHLSNERIQKLYDADADFQSLCADYFLCIKLLKQYEGEPGEKQTLKKEYAEISKDLEKELREFITHAK